MSKKAGFSCRFSGLESGSPIVPEHSNSCGITTAITSYGRVRFRGRTRTTTFFFSRAVTDFAKGFRREKIDFALDARGVFRRTADGTADSNERRRRAARDFGRRAIIYSSVAGNKWRSGSRGPTASNNTDKKNYRLHYVRNYILFLPPRVVGVR